MHHTNMERSYLEMLQLFRFLLVLFSSQRTLNMRRCIRNNELVFELIVGRYGNGLNLAEKLLCKICFLVRVACAG